MEQNRPDIGPMVLWAYMESANYHTVSHCVPDRWWITVTFIKPGHQIYIKKEWVLIDWRLVFSFFQLLFLFQD